MAAVLSDNMFRLAALALAALLSASDVSAAGPDESRRDPLDEVMGRLTAGGSRSDLFDKIERNEAERARQDKERSEREAEVRALLFDISEKIFSIRLNLAEIRGDRPSCRLRRQQEAKLAAEAADLDRLAAAAGARCRAADMGQPGVEQLCSARMAEIATEKAAIEKALDAIRGSCSGVNRDDEEAR